MQSQRLRFDVIGKTSAYTSATLRRYAPDHHHHVVPSSMIRPRTITYQSSVSLIRRSNQHSTSLGNVRHFPVSSSCRSVRWKSSPTVSEEMGEASTAAAAATTKAKHVKDVPQPTTVQLRNHFIGHSIPMVCLQKLASFC